MSLYSRNLSFSIKIKAFIAFDIAVPSFFGMDIANRFL